MFFELIQAEFFRFDDITNVTRERTELMIKLLAQHHATSWGATISGKDVSFLSFTNEGASLMLIPESKKHLKNYFDSTKNPALPKDAQDPGLADCFNNFREIMEFDVVSPFLTINHGDPRLDNFFFNEEGTDNKIGLLDWQLMVKGSCAQGMVTLFGISCSVAPFLLSFLLSFFPSYLLSFFSSYFLLFFPSSLLLFFFLRVTVQICRGSCVQT